MRLAMLVAIWMSPDAPVVTFSAPKISSSAMRPPNAITSLASISRFEVESLSRSGSIMVRPKARPRGMIVTLCKGSLPGTQIDSSAWPASW